MNIQVLDRMVSLMPDIRQEVAELAASTGAGIAVKDALKKWVDGDNNESLKEFLRGLGFSDDSVIMVVAAVAGFGGKWALRIAIRVYEDPKKRAKVARISKSFVEMMKAYVDNGSPTGSLYRTK